MPVVDASVLAEYLAGGPGREAASDALLSAEEALWAPHLIDAEVGHVLRRSALASEIPARDATTALGDLAEFPLRRAGHVGLLERAWELRRNLSFHDALYIALAERLRMPLLTLDARMARTPRIRAGVRVLS